MKRLPFFYRLTEDIRITVRPDFVPERSNAMLLQFVFVYHVRIENVGSDTVQLLSRRWLIHDSAAGDSIVEGEGVIGEQPLLEPGDIHEYRSFCVLKSSSGWMEGSYRFVRGDDSEFDALIPRFVLEGAPHTDLLS